MTDQRMALIELVEKQADGDLVREMLAFAEERIMETGGRGADRRGEGCAIAAAGSPAKWPPGSGLGTPGAGRIALEIPKLRKGSYFPSFPGATADGGEGPRGARHCPRTNGGHGSLQEACVQGISTRSVDDLVKAMGAGGMSKRPGQPPLR